MTTTESLDMIHMFYGIRQMYMQVWETAEKRFSMGVPVQELFDWCKHEYAEKDTFLERVIEDFKQVYSAQSDLQPTCNQLATDCINRQAAIDVPERFIKDCNPEHFVGHQKFIEFMDDAEIGSFGNWQFANGFNLGLTAAEVEIEGLPSAQPEITQEDVELYCRRRCLTVITNELFAEMKARWSAQPKVIRCGECKHSFLHDNGEKISRICGLTRMCGTTSDDWFCADAERREE